MGKTSREKAYHACACTGNCAGVPMLHRVRMLDLPSVLTDLESNAVDSKANVRKPN